MDAYTQLFAELAMWKVATAAAILFLGHVISDILKDPKELF